MEGVDEEIIFEVWHVMRDGDMYLRFEFETVEEAVSDACQSKAFFISKRTTTVTREPIKKPTLKQ